MDEPLLAGRSVGEIYRVQGRADLHEFLVAAVRASGGRVLYVSPSDRAPIYLGVQVGPDERLGIVVYPFRITRNTIKNRPPDEIRGQLRYGSEQSWRRDHPIARDIAGVDVTMIVGIDLADEVILGLDAQLWDPLPMGISFYAKAEDVERARSSGWHVWEKLNRAGSKRSEPRSPTNLETFVLFTADHLLDFARLERRAASLRLDPPLRYAAAVAIGDTKGDDGPPPAHVLEEQFALTSEQILDIISGRNRLSVAVRGGVAEHHLETLLRNDPEIAVVDRLDIDAMHDFDVTLVGGRLIKLECKNASPKTSADGSFRVEVQKTRASKGDPASRFYRADRFDIVAACLFSATGRWEFRFGWTSQMARHRLFDDRLAPIQVITETWSNSLAELVSEAG